MVFTFAEAEFHWQSKWFFRPRQRIGTSVEDYYARFCDWKEEMISLSFPAEEEDYIEGFIENLSWDIRSRLSKYRSGRSRLINAFYDAKFEESMMFIEENLKEIKANRVAEGIRSELTVKEQLQQPIEVTVSTTDSPLSTNSFEVTVNGQVNEDLESAITIENPVVEVLHDDGWLGLEENDGSVYVKSVVQNEACMVYSEMSCDEGSQLNVQPNEVQQVETLVSVTPIAEILKEQVNEPYAHYLFDELPRPLLFEKSDRNGGNSGKKVAGVHGNSENEALKIVDKSTELILTGLKSFPGKFYSNSMIEKVEFSSLKAEIQLDGKVQQPFSFKPEVAKVVYKVFDEMPKLSLVDPNEESYANEDSITSIDCVQLVLDSANGLRYEEIRGLFTPLSMNNNVPPSLTTVTMVYYCSIIVVSCHLFDPGGGHLPQTVSHATLIDKYARNDESSMPDNMCVCIVEWGSNEACKPIMQLQLDCLSWIQRALDSDDVELVRLQFRSLLNKVQPTIVSIGIEVTSDSVINFDDTTLPTYQYNGNVGNFLVAMEKIGLLTFQACDSGHISLIGEKSFDCLVDEQLSFSELKHEEGGNGSFSNMLARVLLSYNKQENIPDVGRKIMCSSTCGLFVWELWVGKVLLFAFDPGVNFWFHNGKQHIEYALKPKFDVEVGNVLIRVRKYQYKQMLEQTEENNSNEHYNRQNSLDRIWRLIPGWIMFKVIGVSLQPSMQEDMLKEDIKRALRALRKRHLVEEDAHGPAFIALAKPFVSLGSKWKEKAENLEIELQQCYKAQSRLSKQLVVELAESKASKAYCIEYFLITVNTAIMLPSIGNWAFGNVLNMDDVSVLVETPTLENSNDYDGEAIAKFENFVWDPGQGVIFLYILEDKDVFERVGKDIVLMDTTLVIRRYDHERQMGCLDDIGLIPKTLLFSTAELEHYIWDPGSFVSVSQLSWEDFGGDFFLTTLRTRWLLRGRICHDMTFYYNF